MKIRRFLIRFLVHLSILVLVSLFISKLYFSKATLPELLKTQKDFVWMSIAVALITALLGEKFTDC